ncbi:fatty acid desaturase [Sulfitobacter mediterraneus]|jgi:fatty acid desaturase|uniref:fatty acid desaturase n=1 Tax=Sulfitobacter mediterraneus TaxID=83219 RepID=UPI0021A6B38E|nr:fatty acid desaturase [Sulfitobacter mediterraneus]
MKRGFMQAEQVQATILPEQIDVGPVPNTQNLSFEWPTICLLAICAALWIVALALPAGWWPLALVLLIPALAQHSSLSHEILHGHPFRADWACTLLGLFQPGLFVPYLRFKALHLAHHHDARLTDPYDDPETNYLDPAVWAQMSGWQRHILNFNNTLLGRMLIGPAFGTLCFVKSDIKLICRGQLDVAMHWILHLPGVVLTLWLVSLSALPLWAYLLACYAALSILKIRTFLEHQAHERASGRSVVIEDRGPLALLFLNNNLHVVHHMHPTVAWYRLPGLYRAQKERFLRRNHGYVFASYGEIFRKFLLRSKDPVAHPLWKPKGE